MYLYIMGVQFGTISIPGQTGIGDILVGKEENGKFLVEEGTVFGRPSDFRWQPPSKQGRGNVPCDLPLLDWFAVLVLYNAAIEDLKKKTEEKGAPPNCLNFIFLMKGAKGVDVLVTLHVSGESANFYHWNPDDNKTPKFSTSFLVPVREG